MPLTSCLRPFTPSCLRPAIDEEAARGRGTAARETDANASDAWRYRPHEHGSPAAFALHPDFQRFREHIAALTQALSAIVQDCPSTVANLQTFLEHVTTVDSNGNNTFFRQHAAEIYDRGAALLDRLAGLMRDPRIDRGQARAELRELSTTLTLCVVAVMEAMPSSLRRLSPLPQTFSAKWHDTKVRVIEQSAIETLRLSDLKTTSRHAVNALLPILYKYVELPDRLPHDPFVWKKLPKSLINEAKRRLDEVMTRSSLSTVIANEYLVRLDAAMLEKDAATSPASLLNLARMETAIEALSAEFGSKPPLSAAFRVDPEDGTCAVAKDATLLAVHFVDCRLREPTSRKHDKASRPIPVGTPPECTTFRRLGRLAWVETRGERRLLELADLPALTPDDLPSSALASVIRNSAPDDLWTTLPAEWMRDTAAFDALLDRIDDTALRACFERWERSPTPLNKDQAALLRDTLRERGRGAPLFATLGWQRLTLPYLEDLEGLRALYHRHRAGEVTTDALRQHLQASWKAATSGCLADLMRMSMPGSSSEDHSRLSGQAAIEWLFAAAEALSNNPPQATIDDISEALRAGTSARLQTEANPVLPLGVQASYEAIWHLGRSEVALKSLQRTQTLRPEHARRLLRDVLNLDDGGRSRLLQRAWTDQEFSNFSFFHYLEAAVVAMVKRGCNWSALNALLQISGETRDAESVQRLAYVRAAILHRSYPDGPVPMDLLAAGFSEIPKERRTFHDVGTQHDGVEAQA